MTGGEPRGRLFRKYVVVLLVLVGGVLVASSLVELYFSYQETKRAIVRVERAKALAFPMGMAVSRNGASLYVGAFGSSKVGVFSTAALETNTFYPNENDQITVSGGGPSGVVLDDSSDKLYVLTRFDNSISIVDTKKKKAARAPGALGITQESAK